MAIKYSDLTPTTDMHAKCYPCGEYKGMVDCPECGYHLCVFCMSACPCCEEEIVF